LLDRALESSHHDIYDNCIKNIFKSYKETNKNSKEILERFDVVSSRGRHKK